MGSRLKACSMESFLGDVSRVKARGSRLKATSNDCSSHLKLLSTDCWSQLKATSSDCCSHVLGQSFESNTPAHMQSR